MSSSKSSGSRRPAEPRSVAALRRALLGVADAMRGWTDDDLDAFLAGQRELTIGGRKHKRATGTRLADEELRAEASRLRSAFAEIDSREEGFEYLDRLALGSDALRRLVLELDLPAPRSDNMERLRNRIVESLIGYRLRSEAIRRTSPRRPQADE